MTPGEMNIEPNVPVIYAGRHFDQISGDNIVSDRDAIPLILGDFLISAPFLTILDILSFPFELLTYENWDLPMLVVIPDGFDSESIIEVLGSVVLGKLEFFDKVCVHDAGIWNSLKFRYSWSESQRFIADPSDFDTIIKYSHNLLDEEVLPDLWISGDLYESIDYWVRRGEAFSSRSPHKAICSVHHDLKFNKAMHRVQANSLRETVNRIRNEIPGKHKIDVLEIGTGIGRWASEFSPSDTNFYGVDISEDMIAEARKGFPWFHFDSITSDLELGFPDELMDLTFTVTVLHHNTAVDKAKLISEMWRVTKPGGWLAFMEQFVVGKQSPLSTVYPMSILSFIDLVLDSTSGRVVLDHLESIRYPGDYQHKTGLLILRKIG